MGLGVLAVPVGAQVIPSNAARDGEAGEWMHRASLAALGTDHPLDVAGTSTEIRGGDAVRSLLLPGWGQGRQGHRRWMLFGTLEAAAWVVFGHQRQDAHRLRHRYRDLAWDVARRPVGARIDGPFEYYEAMGRFRASGAYDRAPAIQDLVPEQDPSTFNGALWLLARQLFLPAGGGDDPASPGYVQALDYYAGRAVRPEFEWDWGDRLDERERFNQLIRRSDSAGRRATHAAGALIVNHLVSALDALLSGGSRTPSGDRSPASVRLVPTPAGVWILEMRTHR